MIFKDHSNLEGKHALLSPSGYSWVNYPMNGDEQLRARYLAQYAQSVGTVLHEFAQKHISFGSKLTKTDKKHVLFYLYDHGIPRDAVDIDYVFENLCHYVNDAIGYRLRPEVILYYSDSCFGTADAINYKDGLLRIHDLKTGKTPTHMEQLDIYAALFCLEYNFKPSELNMELRIYQSDEVIIRTPTATDILPIMDKIVAFDKKIAKMKAEVF